jgi:hypothetical protein
MTSHKEDRLGVGLLWIVHLVCCGLLLILLASGISIGVVTSYLQNSLVPLAIALAAVGIVWAGYRLCRGSTLDGN